MNNAFTFQPGNDGIARLYFDLPGEKVNKLSMPVWAELEKIIDDLSQNKEIKLLAFFSGKPDTFIAGADLKGFAPAFKDPSLLKTMIQTGHRVLRKIELLPFPTVAVIHGVCVGGGLEFALACTYRIVTDHPKTSLGLPEVSLGIFPGWGGTQRLPRLIGLPEGLGMILSAKPVTAMKAYKMKLADAIVAWEFREQKVQEFLQSLLKADIGRQIVEKRRRKGLKYQLLENNPLGRAFIFHQARKDILKKTKGLYPAPIAALDVISSSFSKPLDKGLQIEQDAILNMDEEGFKIAVNLINLFFIQEALKKDTGVEDGVMVHPVASTAVLGAGTMGSGIAWLFSSHDYSVRMKDVDWEAVGKGVGAVYSTYSKGVKDKRLKPYEASLKFQKVGGTVDYSGFKQADLVVEAATENLELKHKIFQELEEHIPADAIIASNTSSLTIREMSRPMKHPERFVGMHFFNPVNRMPLVEIVRGEKTSPEAVATAVDFCKKVGKVPVVVKDCPGFLVNRIFVSGANEVSWMFQEGIEPDRLEKVMLAFGMPMSPFLLADEVGNDVGYKVSKIFEAAYGPHMKCPGIVQAMYDRKLYGKKTGKGFYLYEGSEKKINPELSVILKEFNPSRPEISDTDIKDRVLLMMINEAARCLQEKIVENPGYLDMAMIMGTGFPPFRGGVLRYADELGNTYLMKKLRKFESIYGLRFAPAPLLIEMERKGISFY